MSSEDWLARTLEWREILDLTGLAVDVVVYVRPQVPLFNSAWWQTGAWSRRPFDQWIDRRIAKGGWTAVIEPWLRMPGVRSVSVRPSSGDIVRDFFEAVLRVEPPSGDAVLTSRGMPASILRLF